MADPAAAGQETRSGPHGGQDGPGSPGRARTPSRTATGPATGPAQAPPPERVASGERVRRPADLLFAIGSAFVVALLLGLAHELPTGTQEITSTVDRVVHHVPDVLRVALETVSYIGCIAFVVAALVHLARREALTVLDAVTAAALAAVLGGVAVSVWHTRNSGVSVAVLGAHGSTLSFVVVGVYLAFVTGSDLARRARWTRWCVITSAALGALGGPARLAHRVRPVRRRAGRLGGGAVHALGARCRLRAAGGGRAAARAGRGGDRGGPARGAGESPPALVRQARRRGHAARPPGQPRHPRRRGGAPAVGDGPAAQLGCRAPQPRARSRLEQEALACYAAAAAVLAPRALALVEVGDATLMLALLLPDGAPFDSAAPPQAAFELFGALRRLHAAGVAHGDLRRENLLVADDEAGFSSLEMAVPGSGELVRRIDVVQLLTTTAGVAGVEAAVQAMREGYQPDDERLIAAMLQPVALAPWGWPAMRAAQGRLIELRKALLGDEELTLEVRLERFRWRTVLSAVALTLAAYLLIGQLSKVNLGETLSHTNLGWFGLAIVASAATYLGGAANLAAFVPKRLSLVRGFFVQLSTSFVGFAMPPTVGHVAVNARYLHRQGVDDAATAAAVAISQAVNVVTTVPLLLLLGLLTGSGVSSFHLSVSPALLGVLGAVLAAIGVLFAVARTRRLVLGYLVPRLRNLGPRLLAAVSQPIRMLAGVGGNLLLTISYIVALGASLLAVGAHPSWLGVAAVYLAGNTVGAAAPTPGGLGAVEVVLSAGLTAIGIPVHLAVSAVLLYRLATFWLPIPAGWVSYRFLVRSGTL